MLAANLFSWVLQSLIVATSAALLPIVFRIRHPRTQLYYCHAVLALCLLLPFIQPWETTTHASHATPPLRILLGVLAAGVAIQLSWMTAGLLRIRRYRIASTPLYPVPEAMQAASAITHADALFCISGEATGPVMLGWLAPVVLLPESFLTMSEEAQCGIACHELLHVRRGDWLVTLIEEFSAALMWFNPGVRLLLSEARLAREQLVDAESVRLTASRESYIDALLSIARAQASPDLAPAPFFLRRRHLTQRMQFLLSDAPASIARLFGSYGSVLAVLAVSVWGACAAFPMSTELPLQHAVILIPAIQAKPQVTLPVLPQLALKKAPQAAPASTPPVTDPYEPVTTGAETPATPAERSAALMILNRARQLGLSHAPGTPAYRFVASFVASGKVLNIGQGEITETWLTGQKWAWTTTLGTFSHLRVRFQGGLYEDSHADVIPMRAHMVRNEIFWELNGLSRNSGIRTARIDMQGKPATCVLVSELGSDAALSSGRGWDEEEFCIDNTSGALVLHSIAPGTYARLDYAANQQFHGRPMPDRIVIYVAGEQAVDASFNIADPTPADETMLTPASGMTTNPPPVVLGSPVNARTIVTGAPAGSAFQRAVIHVVLDGTGKIVESEVSSASDPSLIPLALEKIGNMSYNGVGSERQVFVSARFVPASQ